jgi:chromosome segregation ATPase
VSNTRTLAKDAALRLLRSGQRPTADRVRAEIGQGAQQTILGALDEFWKEIGERLSEPRLPEPLLEPVTALWSQAVSAAGQNWQTERAGFEERVRGLESQCKDLRRGLSQETEERERAEARAVTAEKQVRELRREIAEHTAAYKALRAEADQSAAEARRVGDLLEAERDSRERDQAAWLKQIDTARQASKALQAEKEQISRLLSESRETGIRQGLQLTQCEQRERELGSALQKQSKEREEAQAESTTMARRLERLDAELQRCATDVKERDEQVRKIETELRELTEHQKAAQLQHSELAARLQEVQLERESLAGENRALREEVAAVRTTRAEFEASVQLALERLQNVGPS